MSTIVNIWQNMPLSKRRERYDEDYSEIACCCESWSSSFDEINGVCPECGRIIPMDQQKQMREMLDPKWNDYRDPNTAMYKKESAYDPNNDRVGKTVVLIIVVLVIIVIIAIANAGK